MVGLGHIRKCRSRTQGHTGPSRDDLEARVHRLEQIVARQVL